MCIRDRSSVLFVKQQQQETEQIEKHQRKQQAQLDALNGLDDDSMDDITSMN